MRSGVEQDAELERLASLGPEDAERALVALNDPIETGAAHMRCLYDQRRVLFRVLLAADRPRAKVARLAHVTSMAVAFAVEEKATSRSA